jgi:hypothetical protein
MEMGPANQFNLLEAKPPRLQIYQNAAHNADMNTGMPTSEFTPVIHQSFLDYLEEDWPETQPTAELTPVNFRVNLPTTCSLTGTDKPTSFHAEQRQPKEALSHHIAVEGTHPPHRRRTNGWHTHPVYFRKFVKRLNLQILNNQEYIIH